MGADRFRDNGHRDPTRSVARPTQMLAGPRMAASTAALVAGAGHAGTFLALTCGSLWLALQGTESLPLVRKVFVAGLYAQVLPALGFAVVARHLSRVGRSSAAMAAGGLSLVSMLLMGVGTLQVVGGGVAQSFLLALSLVVVTAIGVGVLGGRLATVMKDHFEAEPVVIPEKDTRGS